MGMPLRILQRRMTYAEFRGWCEYYQHEPFDDRRHDRVIATLSALIANIHRDPERRGQPYSSREFMPFEPPVEIDDADLEQRLLKDF